jgi:hypothetical protein
MTSSHPLVAPCQWFSRLATALDRRSAPRLALLFLGAVLARGRRTVTSWIRAAGLSDRFCSCYLAVAAAGKKAETIAAFLVLTVVKPLLSGVERLTLALDDTPTERYGPHVQGAGVHHNPTTGQAGSAYVYGHVVLGLLAAHKAWGVIALPLLARMYVRKKDLPKIDPKHRPAFRAKMELAVDLLRWAKVWLGLLGKPFWVVADGAYAKQNFLKPTKALGMTVVSRWRCDAALWSLPPAVPVGQRGPGRPRVYGTERIGLAKRAGQRRGWTAEAFTLYGERVTKRYKTFRATWRPAGGVIRVVLVDETTGWRAYFCTDPSATVADILTAVADRFSLEIALRDGKEIVGAGQQQARFVWASVGALHIGLWTFTMTEAWAWCRPADRLVDRSRSPWDNPGRRPSQVDKRRASRQMLLREEIHAVLGPGVTDAEIEAAAE